jgi:hypothetical protein
LNKFEYAELKQTYRSYQWGWSFNNDEIKFNHTGKIEILNTLGAQGWQVVDHEQDGEYATYTLMRQVQ